MTRPGLRAELAWAAAGLVAVPFTLLALAIVGDEGPIARFDHRVADDVHGWVVDHPAVADATKLVTRLGEGRVLLPLVALVVGWALARRRNRLAAFLAVTALLVGPLNHLAKAIVGRDRPFFDDPISLGTGHAFPSGHAMTATATWGALLFVLLAFVPRRWRPAAVAVTVAIVLAVGVSRVLLGVHWVSDVVGGVLLGLAWLLATTAVFEIWRIEHGLAPSSPLEEGLEPEAGAELGSE